MAKYKFTAFTGVNTLFNALVNNADFAKLDFSSLKITLGGGMAVQEAVALKWKQVTGVPLIEAYGLTETSPAATINPLDLPAYNGSIGLPISSTELVLRDDAGDDVAIGQPGEICIRGPQVMAGYWQRPDETDKVIDKDGWFATGDVGVMDERGFVKIVDRKKDMILVSGFNVYPNEIEGVMAAHPGVLECAAVGVPDKKSGEAVKLFVVKKDPALTARRRHEVLPREPHRLQVPARHRVPHRAAEVERRQDPAPRAARRGEESRRHEPDDAAHHDSHRVTLPDKEPVLRVVPMPHDTNQHGDIFGGWIMSQVDIAGGVVAARHARGRVATVAVNSFTFKQPVLVGDLVTFFAEVTRIGRTSITVDVEVFAQRNPNDLVTVKVTEASLTYVAVGADRRPRRDRAAEHDDSPRARWRQVA